MSTTGGRRSGTSPSGRGRGGPAAAAGQRRADRALGPRPPAHAAQEHLLHPKPRTGMVFRPSRAEPRPATRDRPAAPGLPGRGPRRAAGADTGAAARPFVAARLRTAPRAPCSCTPRWASSHIPPQGDPSAHGRYRLPRCVVESTRGDWSVLARTGSRRPPSHGGCGPRRPVSLDGPGPARARAGRPGRRARCARGPRASWRVMAVAVVGALDGPEDADRGRLVGPAGQRGRAGRPGPGRRASRRGRGGRPRRPRRPRRSRRRPSGSMTTPCSRVGAEADRLAVHERDQHRRRGRPWPVISSKAPSLKTLQFW